MAPASRPIRHDIQVLRGIAVLLVVLYHADLISIPSGFLGVDIFFVISGFLITAIILKGLDARNFSFGAFYLRRALRLLPAAYCTFATTAVLAYWFLTGQQWVAFAKQLLGALTFSANYVLLRQGGYFDDSVLGKPLLHVWSLSLEEQYYFILPFVLWMIPGRLRPWAIALGICTSLGLCLYVAPREPNIAFYVLPTRVWELLVGSMCAWLMLRRPELRVPTTAKYLALAALIAAPFFTIDPVHPRSGALLVVMATAIILIGQAEWLSPNLITRPVATLGDWSYSLYLIHWPLFAFAHNAYLGEVPASIRFALVALSIALAFLQYRYVERRFIDRSPMPAFPRRRIAGLVVASIAILAIPLPWMANARGGSSDYSAIRRVNDGLGPSCDQRRGDIRLEHCATSDAPRVALWGDSYAMHLAPGLMQEPEIAKSFVQITSSSCGPITGLAFTNVKYTKKWAHNCIAYNNEAAAYISNSKSIKYVVMSSPFMQYFTREGIKLYTGDDREDAGEQFVEQMLTSTISKIVKSGKKVILVGPPPNDGSDVGDCYERSHTGLLVLGRSGCDVDLDGFETRFGPALKVLKKVGTEGVPVYMPSDVMCIDGRCKAEIDGVLLYRDRGHLTVDGSKLVVKRLGLLDDIELDPAD